MSLSLPDRPNLDHLKKQAKDRLRTLQATSPGAQLADAQHALARDYGFASWPKLKAHVEAQANAAPVPPAPSGPPPLPPSMGQGGGTLGQDGRLGGIFPRFTARARQATFFSRFEAAQAGSRVIETEHLVAGLVRARQGLTAPAAMDIPLAHLHAEIDALSTVEPLPNTVVIPFSDATRQVIHRAAEEADGRNHERIGTMHLVLGVLGDPALTGTRMLAKCGVTYATLSGDASAFAGDD
jgi:hypothetical protein